MGLLDKIEKKQVPKDKGTKPEKESEIKPKSKFVTNIDKIYYEVNQSGVAKLKYLSASLGLPIKQIEEYAKLLDQQGLAKIYYPTVGSPRLIRINQKKEAVNTKKKNLKLLIFAILVIIIVALIVFLLYKNIISF